MCALESALSIMLTVVLKPPMNRLAIYPLMKVEEK